MKFKAQGQACKFGQPTSHSRKISDSPSHVIDPRDSPRSHRTRPMRTPSLQPQPSDLSPTLQPSTFASICVLGKTIPPSLFKFSAFIVFTSPSTVLVSLHLSRKMATEETGNNPPPPAAAAPNSALPPYPEMIMAAIEVLNDPNGSNKSAIAKQIESTYGDLPPVHSTLLAHHLNKMKLSGELVMVKNNYMKRDPNAPPKRGRGRPPKPKEPAPAGAVASPPRPRGRPPKPKDPNAPPPPPKTKASAATGKKRGRGRPPKEKSAAAPAAAAAGGVKRGRGRPPKVKPAVAPVGA